MSFGGVIEQAKQRFRDMKMRKLMDEATRAEQEKLFLQQELGYRQAAALHRAETDRLRGEIEGLNASPAKQRFDKFYHAMPGENVPNLTPVRSTMPEKVASDIDISSSTNHFNAKSHPQAKPEFKKLFPGDPDLKFFGK